MRLAIITLLASLVVAGSTTWSGVARAAASTEHDPYPDVILLDCGGAGAFEIAVFGRPGLWTPGHDLASNAIFIPTALEYFAVFTFNQGGGLASAWSIERQAPKNGDDLITCTFHQESSDEVGVFVVNIEVTGYVVNRHV